LLCWPLLSCDYSGYRSTNRSTVTASRGTDLALAS